MGGDLFESRGQERSRVMLASQDVTWTESCRGSCMHGRTECSPVRRRGREVQDAVHVQIMWTLNTVRVFGIHPEASKEPWWERCRARVFHLWLLGSSNNCCVKMATMFSGPGTPSLAHLPSNPGTVNLDLPPDHGGPATRHWQWLQRAE